ncbi:MAG: hypothetical protein HY962_05425 [Ignavibacteriae bacterium]|nr:hypothetical protein [Ignavibacteriota bacterium]
MKHILLILVAFVLVSGAAFSQYENQSAEGTINVQVIQKANVQKLTQTGDFWIVVGQTKDVDWTFKVSGDQTATVDIAWEFTTLNAKITLSNYSVKGDDFTPPTTSQGTTATGSIDDAALSGSTLYSEGYYYVDTKTTVTAVTPGASSVTCKLTLSDYKI